jgi:autotransporter-associated beta strand protein
MTVSDITMATGNTGIANDGVPQLVLGGTSSDNIVTGAISNASDYLTGQALSVVKNNTSTWTLQGNNTYTGLTTVANNGTLILSGNNTAMTGGVSLSSSSGVVPKLHINSATALGTGTLNFGGGAATDTVQIDNSSLVPVNVSTANAITMNRDFTFVGTQSLSLGTGTTTLGGMTSGSNRSITVSANTLTLGGTIAEAVATLGINKKGAGTLLLSGTGSTYTGATIVTAGTLAGIGANAFGSTSGISIAAASTATLSLRGDSSTNFVKTSDSSLYSVTTTANGATINVDQATIAGTGAKTMTIGTLGLNAAITNGTNFTGANNTSLSTGAVTTGASASGTETLTNSITGGGSLTLASIAVNRTGTPTLAFAGNGNTSVTGAITQVATTALTKSGTGTLTLNGTNTYTGDTTINASGGTLQIGGSGSLNSGSYAGAVAIGTSGLFQYSSSANQTLSGHQHFLDPHRFQRDERLHRRDHR